MTVQWRSEDHFQLHKSAFDVKPSPLLDAIEAVRKKWPEGCSETSCKINGDSIHAARFVLWYRISSDPAKQKNGKYWPLAREFFVDAVNEQHGGILDCSLLDRFLDETFDLSKVAAVALGVDVRPSLAESRLKVWLRVIDYQQKIDELLAHFGREEEVRAFLVAPDLLFGFDLALSGSTQMKLYPVLYEADLERDDVKRNVRDRFGEKLNRLVDLCQFIHLKIDEAGDERMISLNPRPWETDTLIDAINDPRLHRVHDVYRGRAIFNRTISLLETEVESGHHSVINADYTGLL